jgi:hypothetical protein
MLDKLHKINNIQEIIDQIESMDFDFKRKPLNYTEGNLLSGNYKVLPEFENTPIGKFLNDLGDMGEARLLILESGETYTAHTDPDDRIHLAITTNPDCYLIDLDKLHMYHLPVDGQVWNMNTGVRHVACNFGGKPRIHLNVRHKLPKFNKPGWDIKVSGGNFDWKQELYDGLMSHINYGIKNKTITGFEKVNERQVHINCSVEEYMSITKMIAKKGFVVTGNPVI